MAEISATFFGMDTILFRRSVSKRLLRPSFEEILTVPDLLGVPGSAESKKGPMMLKRVPAHPESKCRRSVQLAEDCFCPFRERPCSASSRPLSHFLSISLSPSFFAFFPRLATAFLPAPFGIDVCFSAVRFPAFQFQAFRFRRDGDIVAVTPFSIGRKESILYVLFFLNSFLKYTFQKIFHICIYFCS